MTTLTLSSQYNFSANITAYNPVTNVVTLDNPVNISMGSNSLLSGDGIAHDITSKYSISGTVTNILNSITNGTALPQISTDEAGNFVGIFNVPPGTFQTGSRVFRIDNRTTPSDPNSATTYAEATFVASGLSTQSQQLDFAPSVDSSSQTFIQVNQQANQLVSTISSNTPYDPVAQTFMVSKNNYPNGVFLYSVKLFFESKPTTSNAPVTVSIIPTVNGYPGGTALQYSTVTLTPNQVNASTTPHYLDPNTYTEFEFEAPVYIQPGVLYAIMVKSSSTDYNLFFAQQNTTAVPSTAKALPSDPNPTNPTKIGSVGGVGSLFESQNSITWTADQNKDLMFVIDQCVFATNSQASVEFVVPSNLPYRKLGTNDILHSISPDSVSHLSAGFAKNNKKVDAINVSTTDFTPTGSAIDYSYTATLAAGNVPTGQVNITPGSYGSPTSDHVYLNDGQGERVLLRNSNSSFALYATMSSTDPNVSPIISDDGVTLYTVKYIINNMGIGNNVIAVANAGWGYNANTLSVTVSNPDIGSNVATLGFTANTNGAITSLYVINTGSGYLTTPTVTITETSGNTRSGNANAVITITGETGAKGGNSYAKYFTKKVVLAPGNDSGDMRVYYTAYQPLGTAVYVYYKILSSQDTSVFETGNWQLMTTVNNNGAYSTSRADLIEYECAPGIFSSNQANNTIGYTNANGQTFNSYIQFAIKVVLATNDNTNVPFLTDIRALALPAGTGI